VSLFCLALLSAGCVSLDPTYHRPDAPVPATLPGAHGEATVVSQWQQVMNDARLKSVVTMALNSNRDVQKAIADIDAARAQYGETRSSLFPTVDAELSHTRSRTVASGLTTSDEANGAVSSFELDLFGRTRACPARRVKPGLPANSPRRIPADDGQRADHRLGDARRG
jgi:multidrug efflux system outer membrane protein